MILEIYDLESLANLFTYTGYNPKDNKYYQYCICDWRNDIKELYKHITSDKMIMVGYNNLNYDYPLLHHLLNHYSIYENSSGDYIARLLYQKSQDIIKNEFNDIKNKFIPQIDLYKLLHLDNKAKLSSLKDLEIAMKLPDVREMPIKHYCECKEGNEIEVLSYNKWDVYSTYQLFLLVIGRTDHPIYKGENKLELRQQLKKQFHINCINYPDVKIGEQLILKLYSNRTGIDPYELKKKGGTKRDYINLKDCIPSWANFKSKEFNEIKHKFENTVITKIKDSFDESVIYHGIKMYYGTGGLHSSADSGVYESNDDYVILDEDVNSLYPSLAIQLGIYPEHLGKTFLDIYDKDIVSVRLAEKSKPKNERNNVIIKGFKLSANGI